MSQQFSTGTQVNVIPERGRSGIVDNVREDGWIWVHMPEQPSRGPLDVALPGIFDRYTADQLEVSR